MQGHRASRWQGLMCSYRDAGPFMLTSPQCPQHLGLWAPHPARSAALPVPSQGLVCAWHRAMLNELGSS